MHSENEYIRRMNAFDIVLLLIHIIRVNVAVAHLVEQCATYVAIHIVHSTDLSRLKLAMNVIFVYT